MKLTYKMTADEFYKGYNYKIQKIGLNNMAEIVSLVVIMIASIIVSVLGIVNATVILPFAILLCILFVYKQISAKNSITIEFQRSIILNDENTIRLYDEGLEIFSSFEKVYAPWQSIYAIKETKSELIILESWSISREVHSTQKMHMQCSEAIKELPVHFRSAVFIRHISQPLPQVTGCLDLPAKNIIP